MLRHHAIHTELENTEKLCRTTEVWGRVSLGQWFQSELSDTPLSWMVSALLPAGSLTLTSSFGSVHHQGHSNTRVSCFHKTLCVCLVMCRLWIWWLITNISVYKILLILLSTIRKYFKIAIQLTVKATDIKTKTSSPRAPRTLIHYDYVPSKLIINTYLTVVSLTTPRM